MKFDYSMHDHKRIWKTYNQRFINRGKVITLLIEPTLLEGESIQIMNRNKVGRKFEFSSALISAAFIVKCTLRFGYHNYRVFMEDVCRKLGNNIPNFRTIWWRIDKMRDYGVKLDLPDNEPIIGALMQLVFAQLMMVNMTKKIWKSERLEKTRSNDNR